MKNYWTKLHKKTKIGVIISCILLIFGAFFGTKLYIERPRDLGPGLEYVGKSTYGCYVPICSARPASVFYFATDMTQETLKVYFKEAVFVDYPAVGGGGGSGYNFETFFSSHLMAAKNSSSTTTTIPKLSLNPSTSNQQLNSTSLVLAALSICGLALP